ncbi:hypothetical protein WR25_14398 [Diploscapter pachys]|uniref:Uncharacterized protein n=1 Tax=Diploscapter pachys TaxID=2018661 RepID=A0A2A2LI49_9BILA|nr:hypothetical protein WR25_14398 [Diploscapter pachys]
MDLAKFSLNHALGNGQNGQPIPQTLVTIPVVCVEHKATNAIVSHRDANAKYTNHNADHDNYDYNTYDYNTDHNTYDHNNYEHSNH